MGLLAEFAIPRSATKECYKVSVNDAPFVPMLSIAQWFILSKRNMKTRLTGAMGTDSYPVNIAAGRHLAV